MNTFPTPKPQLEFVVTILNGPDKGATYKLISEKISIGRDEENDIVIPKDPKCSRHHAKIVFSPTEIKVFNLNKKNSTLVNGKAKAVQPLTDGSIITVGITKLKFSVNSVGSLPTAAPKANPPMGLAQPGANPSQKRSRQNKNNGKRNFYLLLGALIVLAVAISQLGVDKNSKSGPTLVTPEVIEKEIQDQLAENQKLLDEQKASGRKTNPYKNAQSHFIKGFRDYEKGQFERAIESFGTCLSLAPNHPLCTRYSKLARVKLDKLIQYHLTLGSKRLEQNQYRACMSAFQNVKTLVRDPNDIRYKEATIKYERCAAALEGQY
ncbi:MAG: FHA domain-containing protein [Pseudobdellovibrionaceae bacterium]|nr:FHA domain-containing protein [Bdellovibrionales bacterium]USN47213.1 MAG: FHA domain-containing protein [Pseudobdellovibrionaceae bacterium]